MLALRNIACNDRWEEAWPQIGRQLRQQSTQRAAVRRQHRKTRHGSFWANKHLDKLGKRPVRVYTPGISTQE